jgi:hypothetical protein
VYAGEDTSRLPEGCARRLTEGEPERVNHVNCFRESPSGEHKLTLNEKQRKYVMTEKLLTIPSKLEIIRQIALV